MENIDHLINRIREIANLEIKKTAFLIGNTAKVEDLDYYVTPVRNFGVAVVAGVTVFSEACARDVAKKVDGLVDYVFVDSEKKISCKYSRNKLPANIERAVRETIKKSVLLSYKANDLTVDAADAFISEYWSHEIAGIGGKKIAIIGAGNVGFKLALKLVERGSSVYLYRRNSKKLKLFVDCINSVKPVHTVAKAYAALDCDAAAVAANVLIGTTNGIPVITESIIQKAAQDVLIIDIGKGSIDSDGIKYSLNSNLNVYRLSVESALEGMITSAISLHNVFCNKVGRSKYKDVQVVSGGLLAKKGEFVVDDHKNPQIVYGVGNGVGDFERTPNELKKVKVLEERIKL